MRLSGGCHPREEEDASVRPPGTRLRGGCGAGMRFNAIEPPKNSFRHVLTCPGDRCRRFGRSVVFLSCFGRGNFPLAGHIWHEAAGCSGCCRLLGMNDRRCVIWQKSRERKRRRKDFGMMDRRRDGGVREGRRIPISIHLWESVSFFQWKSARERERERDIEVAE